MPNLLFLCFLLANTLLGHAIATNRPQITLQSISPTSSNSNPPTQSPISSQNTYSVGPSIARKIGKHQNKHIRSSYDTLSPTPSEAPQSEKKMHSEGSCSNSIPSHKITFIEPDDESVLGSQGKVHLLKHHRHSFDKSIAGGGVIVGGLATTFLVAIFCYIKVTARHKPETNA